jgi:hypothetical protein
MLSTGEMTERIRVERPTGTSWLLVAVLSASVLPGGSAAAAPPIFPELAATAPSVPYRVRVWHRTDLSSGMRIRWGQTILAVSSVVDPDNRRHELLIQTGTVPSYADIHAAALAAIANEGFAVTFSKDSTVGYDESTDTMPVPPSTSTVIGYAKWIKGGEPTQNIPGTLSETAKPKLIFVPSSIGVLPAPNAILAINSSDYVVEKCDPCAPQGTPIGAYLEVAQ